MVTSTILTIRRLRCGSLLEIVPVSGVRCAFERLSISFIPPIKEDRPISSELRVNPEIFAFVVLGRSQPSEEFP